MQICDLKTCTGCGACLSICPRNCIEMVENEEGFLKPSIDDKKCIQCKMCISHCPQINPIRLQRSQKPLVYAAFSDDNEQMQKSTSGGIFPILAKHIMKMGGSVYGVEMDNGFNVCFIKVEEEKDLKKLQGSKYVQSNTKMIYKEVLQDLQNGRTVLFSGLPCQIGGLYSFLGKDYDRLYTVDVVCRGVPSEKLLKEYIKFLEKKEGAKVQNFIFRYKKKKWTPMSFGTVVHKKFDNGKEYNIRLTSEPYYMTFLKNIAMKESCYSCSYNGFPRVGDITLGDFAGFGVLKKATIYNKKGISQILLNSEKGNELYTACREYICDEERTLDECCYFNLNLWLSSIKNPNRELFLETVRIKGMQYALKKYVFNIKNISLQKIKDVLIFIIGEKNTLILMHKKRSVGKYYPESWPKNKYTNIER